MLRPPPILALLLLSLTAPSHTPAAQEPSFAEIQRRYDAVVLVADAATGRIVGGVRVSQAFEQRFRPASVFKLAIAATALRNGGAPAGLSYTCTGRDTIDRVVRTCWDRDGHGRLEMSGAIAHSCNLYFRRLAAHTSSNTLVQTARSLGLLTPSGFQGSSEQVPTVKITPDNVLGEAFRVSPAQMLRAALVLAWRGGRGSSDIALGSPAFRPLYQGMRNCVSKGTARAAWSSRYTVAGKTGTDDVFGTGRNTTGWFIGFAPVDRPRYAVCVMFPNGRGTDAALVASMVFQKLL